MLTDDFMEQLKRNKKYVDKFCEKYNVKLLSEEMTDENKPGVSEPMYIFSDNLGGYTIEGIRKSIVGG